ncbi:MAG: hemerythrin family protein [Campylobacterota bacterium]|nr:hemerythrin family protein [Campylobacterota bacterium]
MHSNNKIPWDENYKLGIKTIDIQHKKLFDLVNKLYDLDEQSTKDELRVILYKFSEYVKTHFDSEEAYMLSIKYPDLDTHKQIHQDIIETLNKVISTPATLDIVKTKMRVLAKRALVDHITEVDIKIKKFLSQKQVDEKIFELN